jgi:hypothetical protein
MIEKFRITASEYEVPVKLRSVRIAEPAVIEVT